MMKISKRQLGIAIFAGVLGVTLLRVVGDSGPKMTTEAVVPTVIGVVIVIFVMAVLYRRGRRTTNS